MAPSTKPPWVAARWLLKRSHPGWLPGVAAGVGYLGRAQLTDVASGCCTSFMLSGPGFHDAKTQHACPSRLISLAAPIANSFFFFQFFLLFLSSTCISDARGTNLCTFVISILKFKLVKMRAQTGCGAKAEVVMSLLFEAREM